MFGVSNILYFEKLFKYAIIKQNMRGVSSKKIILVLIFVISGIVGFALAYFAFDYLTKGKQAIIPLSFPSSSPPPSVPLAAKPMEQTPRSTQVVSESGQPQLSKEPMEKEIVAQETAIQKQPVEIKQAPQKEIPTLILNGIFYSQGNNIALINNRIVKEGDLILGLRVTKIYHNKVELDADGQKVTLIIK